MSTRTIEEQEILNKFMKEFQLTPESTLIRYTNNKYLNEENGCYYLISKSKPTEMLVDRYHGFWEVFIASEIGSGIAFLSEREDEYESTDRICVEVKLKDVLDQGGLVYNVTSLPSYLKAFFCTLPEGKVKVSILN